MRNMENIQRMTLEVNRQLHKEIKARALQHNITMKQYVLDAVIKKLLQEKE